MLRNVVGGGLHNFPIEGDGLNQVSVLEAHLMLHGMLGHGVGVQTDLHPNVPLSIGLQ